MKNIYELLATFFYVGRVKYAPGTFGTFIAMILFLIFPKSVDNYFNFLLLAIIFFLGVFVSTQAEKTMGHDNSHIVIDEVLAYWLIMASYIAYAGDWTWSWIDITNAIMAFGLFRIFDILKPYPVNVSQNLPKGWGVMTDDVIAAGLTMLVMWFINFVVIN